MAASFPTTLPTIQRVAATDRRNAPGKEGHVLHNKIADEVESLAAVVGVTGSVVPGTVEARLADVESGLVAVEAGLSTAVQKSARIDVLAKDGVKVGIVGDSITSMNTSTNLPNYEIYYDNGYFTWACALLGMNPSLLYNGGVGGEETSQFFDQLDTAIAAGCEAIFFLGGTNNDDGVDMVRLAFADYEAAHEACRQAGAFFFALTPPPQNADSAGKTARYRSLAALIMARFANRPDSHAADTQAAVYDYSADNWKTNYAYDGVHPGCLGGYYMGKAIFTATVARIAKPKNALLARGADDYRTTDAGSNQVLANPMLTGTSGTKGSGCSGNVATSWQTVCTGGCTAVCSKAVDADGLGEEQVLTATASASGTALLYQAISAGVLAVGDKLRAACEVVIDAGPTGFDNVKLEIFHDPGQKVIWGGKSGNTTVAYDEGFSVTPVIPLTATVLLGALGSAQFTIGMSFMAAGSAVMRVRYPTMRVE